MKRNRIVEVEWLDARTDFGMDIDDAETVNPSTRHSVGFLHSKDKKCIRLAESLTDEGGRKEPNIGGAFVTAIPIGMIKRVRTLGWR